MSLTHIRFIDPASGSVAVVTKGLTLETADYNDKYIGITANDTNSVSMYVIDYYNHGIFKSAYENLVANLKFIKTLNGVSPTEDGLIMINTDRCMSASPLRTTTKTYQTTVVDSLGQETQHWNEENIGTGVKIFDACPSCTSCKNLIGIKDRLENIKMLFNLLKDVNLYPQSIVNARWSFLASYRLRGSLTAECQNGLNPNLSSTSLTPDLKACQLLGNYLTMVHMWNYVVSQNNSSTEIHSATEDTAGFYIQTKRAVPSCQNRAGVSCSITVEPDSVDSNLSMVVISKHVYFHPFRGATTVADNSISVTHTTATKKVVSFNISHVDNAGTFELYVKFIPFLYIQMKNASGAALDFSGINYNNAAVSTNLETDVSGEDLSTITLDAGSLSSQLTYAVKTIGTGAYVPAQAVVLPAATVEQYNSAKTYPSKSITGMNRWKITVDWTLTGIFADANAGNNAGSKTWTEVYYFEATKVRQPVQGILRESKLIKGYVVETTEPEPGEEPSEHPHWWEWENDVDIDS